jgi:transcriptional regulator with XRE-family HTH domain
VLEDRRLAFCARLKAARENKGVTLESIAASTKIGRPLLKGLEENDLSRWPQGLYRRAYLRNYLRAIDLLEESTVADFGRLFPDEETLRLGSARPAENEEPCALSLTLAEGRPERLARMRPQFAVAAIDLGVVLALSALGWWALGAGLGASSAVVAIGYYSIGTAVLGRSFGSRFLEDRSWRLKKKKARAVPTGIPDTLLARIREAKGLPGQPEPAVTGGLFGMLIVGVIRTLLR